MKLIDLSDLDALNSELERVANDQSVRVIINKYIAKTLDKYVPYETGQLSSSVDVTSEGLEYHAYSKPSICCPDGDYSHYVYEGEVYGTNIPITHNGMVVGFYSPKGVPKHPKGQAMQYTMPLARSHWDEALEDNPNEIKKINKYAKGMITRRLKKIGG